MEKRKSQKKSEVLVEELKKRSSKALELARKTILAEKTESMEVRQALEYYTSQWSDFTHPGFFSIACEAVGADPNSALPVQAAMAMIAAAFDIHDDIIDRSKKKHRVPTVFGKFGVNMALLLGDAFLIEGFALFDESIAGLPRDKMKEALETFKAALFEVGNAHALELNVKQTSKASPSTFMRILDMKAASVEADMRIGALVGGGTKSEIANLTKFGRILGKLATLREEFIDVFEIEELKHRIHSECLPAPILYAMQDKGSKEKIQKVLTKGKITGKDVDKLLDIVLKAKSVIELRRRMQSLVTESFGLLPEITSQNSRKLLQDLTEYALEDL